MEIGGLQRFSLIDYPGKICAIIFTRGCNFRCPYCHNPELVEPKCFGKVIPEEEVLSFLEKRRGKLDAVTITGGEPLLQPDIVNLIRHIRSMGFLVKLDTNGSLPHALNTLLHEVPVDYIAMDVKAPLPAYGRVARVPVRCDDIGESIDLIISSGIDHEFRTTIPRSILGMKDLFEIGRTLKGAQRYVLQRFVPAKTLDETLENDGTLTDDEFASIKERLDTILRSVIIR